MPIGLWFTLTPLRTHTAPLRDTLPHPVKGESETEQWRHRIKPSAKFCGSSESTIRRRSRRSWMSCSMAAQRELP